MRTAVIMLLVAAVSASPFSVTRAQSTRHGVITKIQPIDNRGNDETQTTKLNRKMGGLIGNLGGMFAARHGGDGAGALGAAAPVAGQVAGQKIGEKVGGPGPSAHFMVKLKMDSGKVLPTVQEAAALEGLHVGSRVSVESTGTGIFLSKN